VIGKVLTTFKREPLLIGAKTMTNIDMKVDRELTEAELESVAGGTVSLPSLLAGADAGSKAGSSWGQSHFGNVGGAVGGVVGAIVGAVGALFG
jgi:hypothetical protein